MTDISVSPLIRKASIWISMTLLMLAPFFVTDLLITLPPSHYAVSSNQSGNTFQYEISSDFFHQGSPSLYFLSDAQFTQVKINNEILFTRNLLHLPNRSPTKSSVLLEIPSHFWGSDIIVEIKLDGFRLNNNDNLTLYTGPIFALENYHFINILALIFLPVFIVSVSLCMSFILFFIWIIGNNKKYYLIISLLLFSSCVSEFVFSLSEYASIPKPVLLMSAVLPASGLSIFWILFWRNSIILAGPKSRAIISGFVFLILSTIAVILMSPENAFENIIPVDLKQILAIQVKLFVWVTLILIGISSFHAYRKNNNPELYVIFVCSMVYFSGSIGLLVHDISLIMSRGNAPLYGQYRGFFFTLYLLITVLIMKDWVNSMNSARNLSELLSFELQAAKLELARNFEQRIRSEQEILIRRERENLMRDLHDGVGNRLTSTIALCRMNPETPPQVRDGLQNTLLDLRLMMSAMSDTSADLHGLIANFLPQLQRQTRSFGVELECDLLNLPEVHWLRPQQAQHVLRFLLEAVTNAAKHSGATTIRLEGSAETPRNNAMRHACLAVRDKGHGGVVQRPGSFGLQSMRERAAALGGELIIHSTAQGTDVLLYLPVNEETSAASA